MHRKHTLLTDIQSRNSMVPYFFSFGKSCCVMFFLSIEKLEWSVGGLISKNSAPLSLKICMVAPDMCDYQNVSQIFISCLVWEHIREMFN